MLPHERRLFILTLAGLFATLILWIVLTSPVTS